MAGEYPITASSRADLIVEMNNIREIQQKLRSALENDPPMDKAELFEMLWKVSTESSRDLQAILNRVFPYQKSD